MLMIGIASIMMIIIVIIAMAVMIATSFDREWWAHKDSNLGPAD